MKVCFKGKNIVYFAVFVLVGASVIQSVIGGYDASIQSGENILISVQSDNDIIKINYKINETR